MDWLKQMLDNDVKTHGSNFIAGLKSNSTYFHSILPSHPLSIFRSEKRIVWNVEKINSLDISIKIVSRNISLFHFAQQMKTSHVVFLRYIVPSSAIPIALNQDRLFMLSSGYCNHFYDKQRDQRACCLYNKVVEWHQFRLI